MERQESLQNTIKAQAFYKVRQRYLGPIVLSQRRNAHLPTMPFAFPGMHHCLIYIIKFCDVIIHVSHRLCEELSAFVQDLYLKFSALYFTRLVYFRCVCEEKFTLIYRSFVALVQCATKCTFSYIKSRACVIPEFVGAIEDIRKAYGRNSPTLIRINSSADVTVSQCLFMYYAKRIRVKNSVLLLCSCVWFLVFRAWKQSGSFVDFHVNMFCYIQFVDPDLNPEDVKVLLEVLQRQLFRTS